MSFLHKTRRRWQRFVARRNRIWLDRLTYDKAIIMSSLPDLGMVVSGRILDELKVKMMKRDERKAIRAKAAQPESKCKSASFCDW